jgi:hypothetical protein
MKISAFRKYRWEEWRRYIPEVLIIDKFFAYEEYLSQQQKKISKSFVLLWVFSGSDWCEERIEIQIMCHVVTQMSYYVKAVEYIHGTLLKLGSKEKQYDGREGETTPCFLPYSSIACFRASRRYVPFYLTFEACRPGYGSSGGVVTVDCKSQRPCYCGFCEF